jgi:hypothetical protein
LRVHGSPVRGGSLHSTSFRRNFSAFPDGFSWLCAGLNFSVAMRWMKSHEKQRKRKIPEFELAGFFSRQPEARLKP